MTDQITTTQTKIYALPLDQQPAAVYLASLASESGRRAQRQALRKIAQLLGFDGDYLAVDWSQVRFQHCQAIRTHLLGKYAPATCNRLLSALKGTLRAAWRLGQLSAEDFQRAIDLQPVNGSSLPAGRAASPGELAALMATCEADPGPAGVRDAAMIALAFICGLRRAELAALNLEDYDQVNGEITVLGKRQKKRLVYPTNGAAAALDDWLQLRGRNPGPLFVPITKTEKLQPGRLSAAGFYRILQIRANQAGIESLTPHDLRRSFISQLLDQSVDLAIVSKMAGHANLATTIKYDRRPELAKRKAADLLHVPYHRRKK